MKHFEHQNNHRNTIPIEQLETSINYLCSFVLIFHVKCDFTYFIRHPFLQHEQQQTNEKVHQSVTAFDLKLPLSLMNFMARNN